ncbi:MAG: L-aspartate oxidase [Candidatus Cloacimonetes bacterium 4572_55]|nr:MAG: L-aspartate oxidase [Candidatus Cloacimonetes bacterium 4572_55]
MTKIKSHELKTDFLVVGSGIAGLSFALRAAELGEVVIVTKKRDFESNTNYAQGGIASVISSEDSFDDHYRDTIKAGGDLGKQEIVKGVVQEGPECIQDLISWGVQFTKTHDKEFALGREGGHSKRRIIHAADLTGREIEHSLLQALKANPRVTMLEDHVAIDLITQHHLANRYFVPWEKTTCWGVYALDSKADQVCAILAKATLLATGGAGQVYLHTTNPQIATGDGICMAYRAGAEIANLEFVQFHPTTLYQTEQKKRSFLISEAVRGEGASLRTKDGKRFMPNYHPMEELAPRDVVARAIDQEMKRRGELHIWLDVTHLSKKNLQERFPHIYSHCLMQGIDISKEFIPVVPAAHYMCGGIVTDLNGQTSIRSLYASGEVTHTGLHGANRLASNSLLEAVVFSKRAFQQLASDPAILDVEFPEIPPWDDTGVVRSEESVLISHDRHSVRRLMWDYVGIVRTNRRLERARSRMAFLRRDITEFYRTTRLTPELIELRNLVIVADLTIRCALMRKESRGLHYNADYTERDDKHWLRDMVVRSSQL